jgi:hypothetical protein
MDGAPAPRYMGLMKRTCVLGLVSLLLASTPALAAGGDDEVDLKNGGMLRGTVVSMEPGKEVVILIQGTGEQRRVPWNEVDKVSRGNGAPAAPPPPPPPMMPPPPPGGELSGPADGAPRVHIRTETPGMALHQITTSIAVVGYGGVAYGMISRPVCVAPCDQVVDGRNGQLFFFAGEGTTQSSRFQLLGRGPEVVADVKGGGVWKRFGGFMLAAFGGAAVVTSATLFALGAAGRETYNAQTNQFDKSSNSGMMIGGGVLAGAGVGMLAGGIVMIVQSVTRYSFAQPGAPPPQARLGAPLFTF